MNDSVQPAFSRRTVLAAGGATVVSLAGCLGGSEPSGPQRRAYTLTLTRSGGTLGLRIEPAGEVADVIRIHVCDTVEFTVVNEAAVPVGFHNHANDVEFVVEPGQQRATSFEATEAMTGRQEIEGWVVEDEHGGAHDEHGGEATSLAVIEVRPGDG